MDAASCNGGALQALFQTVMSLGSVGGEALSDMSHDDPAYFGATCWTSTQPPSAAVTRATKGGESFVSATSSRMRTAGEEVRANANPLGEDADDSWSLFASDDEVEAILLRECWKSRRKCVEALFSKILGAYAGTRHAAGTATSPTLDALFVQLAAYQDCRELLLYPLRIQAPHGITAVIHHLQLSCNVVISHIQSGVEHCRKRPRTVEQLPGDDTQDAAASLPSLSPFDEVPVLAAFWDAVLCEILLGPSRIVSKSFVLFEALIVTSVELLEAFVAVSIGLTPRSAASVVSMAQRVKSDWLLIFLSAGSSESHFFFLKTTLSRLISGLLGTLHLNGSRQADGQKACVILLEVYSELIRWVDTLNPLPTRGALERILVPVRTIKRQLVPLLTREFLGICGAAPGLQNSRLQQLRHTLNGNGAPLAPLAMWMVIGSQQDVQHAMETFRASSMFTQAFWRLRIGLACCDVVADPKMLTHFERLLSIGEQLLEMLRSEPPVETWIATPEENAVVNLFQRVFGSVPSAGISESAFRLLQPDMVRILGDRICQFSEEIVQFDHKYRRSHNTSLLEVLYHECPERFGGFMIGGVAVLYHRIMSQLVEPLKSNAALAIAKILVGDPTAEPSQLMFESKPIDVMRTLLDDIMPIEFSFISSHKLSRFVSQLKSEWCHNEALQQGGAGVGVWLRRIVEIVLHAVITAVMGKVTGMLKSRRESMEADEDLFSDTSPLTSGEDASVLEALLQPLVDIMFAPVMVTATIAIENSTATADEARSCSQQQLNMNHADSFFGGAESSPWVLPSSVPVGVFAHSSRSEEHLDASENAPPQESIIEPPPLIHESSAFPTAERMSCVCEGCVADRWVIHKWVVGLAAVMNLVPCREAYNLPTVSLRLPDQRQVTLMRLRHSDDAWHAAIGSSIGTVLAKLLVGNEGDRRSIRYDVCANYLMRFVMNRHGEFMFTTAARTGLWRTLFCNGQRTFEPRPSIFQQRQEVADTLAVFSRWLLE